jgi:hypothetical protein
MGISIYQTVGKNNETENYNRDNTDNPGGSMAGAVHTGTGVIYFCIRSFFDMCTGSLGIFSVCFS